MDLLTVMLPPARQLARFGALLLALCLLSPAAVASDLKLVINPPPHIQTLGINEARGIFSMRVRSWPDGSAISVFVLPGDTEQHKHFVKQHLKLLPHQLKRNWDRMVYTGTGQAPIEVADEQEMLARLKATPGSVGYTSREVISEQLLLINTQ